jgi:AraC-like DNA-binding protein
MRRFQEEAPVYNELKFEDNFPLNVRDYAKQTDVTYHYSQKAFTIPHCHNYWEFTLILEGFLYTFINGKQIKLTKNTFCVIRPADKHYFKGSSSAKFRYTTVLVRDSLMKKQLDIISPSLYGELIAGDEIYFAAPSETINAADNLLQLYSLIPLDEIQKQEIHKKRLFLYLINAMLDNIMTTNKHSDSSISSILALFEAGENLKLNVADICEIAHYSRTHINRLFKKFFNQSAKDYLVKRKMTYACHILRSTDDKILNISSALGYSSLGQFNKLFKSTFDFTPSAYRKKYRMSL